MKRSCSICGSIERELRPYGKNGADICFRCMMDDPKVEAEARKQFGLRLVCHGPMILDAREQAGPRKMTERELDRARAILRRAK